MNDATSLFSPPIPRSSSIASTSPLLHHGLLAKVSESTPTSPRHAACQQSFSGLGEVSSIMGRGVEPVELPAIGMVKDIIHVTRGVRKESCYKEKEHEADSHHFLPFGQALTIGRHCGTVDFSELNFLFPPHGNEVSSPPPSAMILPYPRPLPSNGGRIVSSAAFPPILLTVDFFETLCQR
uniref:Uncharacterized protein n=1 Tax=Sphaerodactylus townsendi TaxID=933632 RepID=A0ACB8FVL7_9SAUR